MATTTFVPGNNVNTTLAAAASNTATTLTLSSSANLPTLTGGQQMALTLNDAATGAIYEVTYVTAITGATLTVLRGQEGTTAQNWSIGDFAFCAPTAGTVAQVNGNPANQFQVATATAANQSVPLAQAQAMRGTYNGANSINASTNLAVTQCGAVVFFYGSTASQTLTLPAASSTLPGQGYLIVNFSSVPVTVARSSTSDTILVGASMGVTSIVLQPGDDLEIEAVSSSQWLGSGAATRQFTPLVVAPATAPNHAATMAQAAGVVGSMRNLSMSVAAASSSATLTADEIVVETALGGVRYCVASVSKTINLAVVGAGGMDVGSAPAPGFVGIYLIFSPSTGTSALLATNATNSVLPNIYGGSGMPAGYTASALVSVVPTNSSGQFTPFMQRDRSVSVANRTIISTSSGSSTPNAYTTTAFPKNAVRVKGYSSFTSPSASTVVASVYADAFGDDQSTVGLTSTAGSFGIAGSFDILISQPQTIYYSLTSSSGAPTWGVNCERYDF